MPGKWGGVHRVRPPRSANELGCQANGGAHAGRTPLDPPMQKENSSELKYSQSSCVDQPYCWLVRGSLFIELGCPRDLGKG